MAPFYTDAHLTIHLGDVRDVLAAMEPESVQCVVTSPPYFSLRDYGIPPSVWGGEPGHAHEWTDSAVRVAGGTYTGKSGEVQPGERRQRPTGRVDGHPEVPAGTYCPCGAWLGCLGLEPTPAEYVAHMVDVFREVRRVLRRDGTVWLNLGDTYASHDPGDRRDGQFLNPEGKQNDKGCRAGPAVRNKAGFYRTGSLKAKDRMMIPARVAIALQEDGWWLRDEIVWAKPNPMPSSVRDRTTPAHEMVYLLSRSARYHYDGKAIAEPMSTSRAALLAFGEDRPDRNGTGHVADRRRQKVPGGWAAGTLTQAPTARSIATAEPRPTYIDKQAAAATPSGSATSRTMAGFNDRWDAAEAQEAQSTRNKRSVWTVATEPYHEAHFATFPERLIEPMILAGCPSGGVVLDPFGGSGTVGVVAGKLGRRAVLIDRSPAYVDQMIRRNAKSRASGEGPAVDMPVAPAADGLWGEVPA